MNTLQHPANAVPDCQSHSKAWSLWLIIPLLASLWWVMDLWQLATVKWAYLNHEYEDGIPAHKLLQLSMLAGFVFFALIAAVTCFSLLGWSAWFIVACAGVYCWLTAIRWF